MYVHIIPVSNRLISFDIPSSPLQDPRHVSGGGHVAGGRARGRRRL